MNEKLIGRWPKGHKRYERVLICVPPDLLRQIDLAATAAGKSRSAWLTDAVQEKLENNEISA